ncbi:MAG: response regulator transcription factor [Chitinophagaceae bacterium]|nr:response regulator transcription factor [Chitinophagaceae bacterium]MBK9484448.1 response regulator transcription factor [Chitinophagaceae bacterium]MBL0199041.1 response regulator transcription factor [Chitinophagaceae bacterium]
MIKIALVDDHSLLRMGLASLMESQGNTVLFEADNGKEFVNKLDANNLPQIVLMDINMPEMDGFETTQWLKQHYPGVLVLALSMYDNETSIIRMLKCGAKGYILKDSEPAELKTAIDNLLSKGFYYSDLVSGKLMHAINKMDDETDDLKNLVPLNERETTFLKYTCTELTYREIADKMFVSPRTIDGYRDALFEKLKLKTRVGLVMYAIKNGIVNV